MSVEPNVERVAVSNCMLRKDNRLEHALREHATIIMNYFRNKLKGEHLHRLSNLLVWKWSLAQFGNVPNAHKLCLRLLFVYLLAHTRYLLNLEVPSIPGTVRFGNWWHKHIRRGENADVGLMNDDTFLFRPKRKDAACQGVSGITPSSERNISHKTKKLWASSVILKEQVLSALIPSVLCGCRCFSNSQGEVRSINSRQRLIHAILRDGKVQSRGLCLKKYSNFYVLL